MEGSGRGNQAHGSYFCPQSSSLSQVDKTLQCFIVLVQLIKVQDCSGENCPDVRPHKSQTQASI